MEAEDAIGPIQHDPRESQVSMWPATVEQLEEGCATSMRLCRSRDSP